MEFLALLQDEGMNPAFGIIGPLLGAGIGYMIGKGKNRPILGLVLGGLLGCIGWIIVGVMSPADN